jgi:hypothetical protein
MPDQSPANPAAPVSKLARLKKRRAFIGDVEDIIDMNWLGMDWLVAKFPVARPEKATTPWKSPRK